MLCAHECHMDMALSPQQFPQTLSSLLGRFCLFWQSVMRTSHYLRFSFSGLGFWIVSDLRLGGSPSTLRLILHMLMGHFIHFHNKFECSQWKYFSIVFCILIFSYLAFQFTSSRGFLHFWDTANHLHYEIASVGHQSWISLLFQILFEELFQLLPSILFIFLHQSDISFH